MSTSWDILKNTNDFVRFSDAKAGVVLAFAGGSAAFLSGKADVINGILLQRAGPLGWVLFAVVLLYLLALLWTLFCGFASIWPSLGSGGTRSLIYFKHICEDYSGKHEEYAKTLAGLDDSSINMELAHQICVNASVATRKYKWVGRAITGLAVAIGAWAITVFLILLLGPATPSGS